MKTQTKVNLVMGGIVAICITVAGLLAVTIANEALGTTEVTGERYEASYTYCGGYYAGAGGQSHCTLWATGHETRIKTIVHGLWWETTSSVKAK
jgi:hypothetical protein